MKVADLAAFSATVHGHVQGVFFRDFVRRAARSLGVTGYVRNLPTGETVEVCAEGERKQLESLIAHLKVGPPGARVEGVEVSWSNYSGSFSSFNIKY